MCCDKTCLCHASAFGARSSCLQSNFHLRLRPRSPLKVPLQWVQLVRMHACAAWGAYSLDLLLVPVVAILMVVRLLTRAANEAYNLQEIQHGTTLQGYQGMPLCCCSTGAKEAASTTIVLWPCACPVGSFYACAHLSQGRIDL